MFKVVYCKLPQATSNSMKSNLIASEAYFRGFQ